MKPSKKFIENIKTLLNKGVYFSVNFNFKKVYLKDKVFKYAQFCAYNFSKIEKQREIDSDIKNNVIYLLEEGINVRFNPEKEKISIVKDFKLLAKFNFETFKKLNQKTIKQILKN